MKEWEDINFNIHGAIMAQLPKIRKPPVGFSARFFGEIFEICKMLPDKTLQGKKPLEK